MSSTSKGPPRVTVFVGTANLGNAPPDKASLSAWVPRDGRSSLILPDSPPRVTQEDACFGIIVLGFQEAIYDIPEDTNQPLLHRLLQNHLPSYQHVVQYQRGEMRLDIFVHRTTCHVRVLHVAAQNTGRAGLPNKGGILAELAVGLQARDTLTAATKLSVTTCHLEAHEGIHKYRIRCATMADILSGTRPPGEMHDTSITSHYCFVLGDLNFRTELPPEKFADEEDHKRQIRKLIEQQDWEELSQYDELRRALRNKDCLAGFETPSCDFPPTFKVERRRGLKYLDQRRPSYTDRILYKTGHGLEGGLCPLLYEPVEDFATSDHKPVRGVFEIQLNERIILRPRLTRIRSMRQHRLSMSSKEVESNNILSSHSRRKKDQLVLHVSRIKCQLNRNVTLWHKLSRRKSKSPIIQQPHSLNTMESQASLTNHSTGTMTPTSDHEDTSSTTLSSPRKARLPSIVPSPYIMFVASPEECVPRRVRDYWDLKLEHLTGWFRRVRRRMKDGDNTTSSSHPEPNCRRSGWPRTSVQRRTLHADWGSECVKIRIQTHLPSGQTIPLTGSMLKMSVMDGEGLVRGGSQRHPLIGTFSFNLAKLLIQCLHASGQFADSCTRMDGAATEETSKNCYESADFDTRFTQSSSNLASLSIRSRGMPRRSGVRGLLGLGGSDLDRAVLEFDIDEPLLRNGKEVGRLQCRVEASWVNHSDLVEASESSKCLNCESPSFTSQA